MIPHGAIEHRAERHRRREPARAGERAADAHARAGCRAPRRSPAVAASTMPSGLTALPPPSREQRDAAAGEPDPEQVDRPARAEHGDRERPEELDGDDDAERRAARAPRRSVMFIETSTTPSAATSRSSARGRPRSCGRAIAQSAAEPKSSRRKTTPGRPELREERLRDRGAALHRARRGEHERDRGRAPLAPSTSSATAPRRRASSTMPSTRGQCERDLLRAEEPPAVDRRTHRRAGRR